MILKQQQMQKKKKNQTDGSYGHLSECGGNFQPLL